MSNPIVSFKDVDIVFGPDPESALPLIDKGESRETIQRETGQVLGVAGANLDVREGEIIVLMGLSGSGKSTLLRAVNGLNPVIRGETHVDNGETHVDPQRCSPRELRQLRMERVAMVFQQFGLLPWRSVSDNVGFGLELSGMSIAKRKARVAEQLELVGLSQWADRRVNELSGGMQQRVGLARAFATGAPILLMDEPFSALDPLIRTRLQDELLQLQQQLRKTIIFVSHDLDEAFRIGNRIAIMEGGRIVQCGTPQDIVQSPANEYVADFVANMNPLSMLHAADVMAADDKGRTATDDAFSAVAKPDTPLTDVLDALANRPGTVGIVDNGTVVGTIGAQEIIKGLTSHRQSATQ
ncbi:choline ABC transporter ATP-binding protein [Hoeflea prorocentri]|uniref:Choline ABC transporter ATP-binding protein n=1 Tax=Hoeflea prorocentri TaxID=1922333 RepID=A0A9X3UDW2_9HYPH|nr:choline ABC transporter ATP-binding protein [Hoeflea prorocentri]MCY6379502.1 choline ABC transporter ATP-binding protein [Hoeflea prorocentri]MDA5397302.1 choline ABC transporter ATP-binding protein [Hoeflea prorocentri]